MPVIRARSNGILRKAEPPASEGRIPATVTFLSGDCERGFVCICLFWNHT